MTKDKIKIFIFASLFIFLSSVVTYLLRYVNIKKDYLALMIGFGILAVSFTLMILFHKKLFVNIIAYVLGIVALGFMIRSWYLHCGYDNDMWILFFVFLASCLYYIILRLLLRISERYRHLIFFLYIGITLVAYIVVIIVTKTTYVSTFGYYMIMTIGFIIVSIISDESDKRPFELVTWGTYSGFIVAIVIAVIISSEGEALEGIGELFSGTANSKGKNAKKTK